MRTRRSLRRSDLVLAGVMVATGAIVGYAASATSGALTGAGAAVAVAAGVWIATGLRLRRRRQLLRAPFPDTWRRFLEERYEHYERLPTPLRRRFEDDVRIFLAETRISGVGIEPTDDLRLLVAASAATLSLGWPDYEWRQVTEVLLYPQSFDRDYGFDEPELAGEAHPWGTVILSVPSLHESFADPWDAFHVGLHEFAHLLGLRDAEIGAVPVGFPKAREAEWLALIEKERDRMRRGKSVIDDYGEESPGEFMAVAVEAFFECSLSLRMRHREVYAILAEYFRQDPAAWDDQRGLVL